MYSLVVSGDPLWALRPLTAGWQKKRRNEAAGSHNKNRFDNHPCFPAFLAITSLVPVNLFIMNTTDAVKAANNSFPSIVARHFRVNVFPIKSAPKINIFTNPDWSISVNLWGTYTLQHSAFCNEGQSTSCKFVTSQNWLHLPMQLIFVCQVSFSCFTYYNQIF